MKCGRVEKYLHFHDASGTTKPIYLEWKRNTIVNGSIQYTYYINILSVSFNDIIISFNNVIICYESQYVSVKTIILWKQN